MQFLQKLQDELKEIREQFQQGVPSTLPGPDHPDRFWGIAANSFDKRFNVYSLTMLDLLSFKLKEKTNEIQAAKRSLKRLNIFIYTRNLSFCMLHRGFELHPNWIQICTFIAQILGSPISKEMFQDGKLKSTRQIDDLGIDPKFNLKRVIAEMNQELKAKDCFIGDGFMIKLIQDQMKRKRFMVPVHFTLLGQQRMKKMTFINNKLALVDTLQRQINELTRQFRIQKQAMIRYGARMRQDVQNTNALRQQLRSQIRRKNAPVEDRQLPSPDSSQVQQIQEVQIRGDKQILKQLHIIKREKSDAQITSQRRKARKEQESKMKDEK